MASGSFAKLEARWLRERTERVSRSAELKRRLAECVRPVLEAHGVRKAWLFGSVAAGTVTPDSDVDLLVVPVSSAQYWPLRRDLEEALGCSLDLCTQDDDPVLVGKVKERGELIYEVQP
jgi:predicted nucleotidyltransferase